MPNAKKVLTLLLLTTMLFMSACSRSNTFFSNPDEAYAFYKKGANLIGLTMTVKVQDITYSDNFIELESYNSEFADAFKDIVSEAGEKLIYKSTASANTNEICVFVNSDALAEPDSVQIVNITKVYERQNTLYIIGYITEETK